MGDCAGHGLCCFDGCANVCVGAAPLPVPVKRTPIVPVLPLSPIHVVVPRSPQRPTNPCQPSPCGPGTICTTNAEGNAICNCEPGLIPKPDTITGCGPECVTDPECRGGQVCLNQRCVAEPDPCNPSPCGPGARCTAQRSGNRYGNPICKCEPGLVPKPDTITGCGPECVIDPDCSSGYVCLNQRCVDKPDPCDPSPCGPGARCTTNAGGNAICRCEPGLIPKPDTITGCGPECIRDPDCPGDYVCEQQKCIPRPDPCDPSPCGPGATCSVAPNGNPICRCEPGLIPKPDTITGCGPECVVDPDCQGRDYVCQNQKCVLKPDPCDPSPCGPGTMCMVNKIGNPICRCLKGLIPKPDTITGCGPECTVDPDCSTGYVCENQKCVEAPDPCNPSPCGPNAISRPSGVGRSARCTCTCPPGHFGDPNVSCTKGECQRDEECQDDEACQDHYCVKVCKPATCQKDFFCRPRRHVAVCGREYVPTPQEPRDLFVIGESYKRGKEPSTIGTSSGVFVIGSRHSSAGADPSSPFSSSSRTSRSSSSLEPSLNKQDTKKFGHSGAGGRSPSKQVPVDLKASVIGATYRKRRHLPPSYFFQF